jgi:hypothetical protein
MFRSNLDTMSINKFPRVLIYKRTHTGDPNPEGVFGIEDCMGEVRARQFDAVIGIGGISAWRRSLGINHRVNWLGIGPDPRESRYPEHRGPWVTFDHFVLLDTKGPAVPQALARHMYYTNRRVVMSNHLPNEIEEEVQSILKLAEDKSPSPARKRSDYPKSQELRFNPCLCHLRDDTGVLAKHLSACAKGEGG